LRLFDSHCHLYDEAFDEDRAEVLARAEEAGLARLLVVGSDEVTSLQALALARVHKGLFCAVGYHPHESRLMGEEIPRSLKEAVRDRHVVAIGEVGLDYYYDHSERSVQRKVFARQIAWAADVGLPLVVHVRDAFDDALALLESEGASRCGGVLHCFSGDALQARRALDLGFYLSFAGPLTFKKNDALRDVAASVPLDRLLIETDAPYLSPHPRRGRRNEPALVVHTFRVLAEVKGMGEEELADRLWENGRALFRW
jgi:TatD DNase family protein